MSVPADAIPFYVSDALGAFNVSVSPHWKYPGCANTDLSIGPNIDFKVWIFSASLNLVPMLRDDQGINADVTMTLYDAGTGLAVQSNYVNPDMTNFPLAVRFASPYGGAPNGLIINQSMTGETVNVSRRDFSSAPIVLQGRSPNVPGHTYVIGAAFKFHFGPARDCQYDYHVHGAWKAD